MSQRDEGTTETIPDASLDQGTIKDVESDGLRHARVHKPA
jgi:hypothetical protein